MQLLRTAIFGSQPALAVTHQMLVGGNLCLRLCFVFFSTNVAVIAQELYESALMNAFKMGDNKSAL